MLDCAWTARIARRLFIVSSINTHISFPFAPYKCISIMFGETFFFFLILNQMHWIITWSLHSIRFNLPQRLQRFLFLLLLCCLFWFFLQKKSLFLIFIFSFNRSTHSCFIFFFFLSWCEIRNCISIFLTLEIGGWKIHNRVGLFVCLLACLLLFFHSHGRQVCWWCFDFEMQSWTKQVRKTLLMLAHKFQTRILIDPSYRKRTIDTAHQNVLLK